MGFVIVTSFSHERLVTGPEFFPRAFSLGFQGRQGFAGRSLRAACLQSASASVLSDEPQVLSPGTVCLRVSGALQTQGAAGRVVARPECVCGSVLTCPRRRAGRDRVGAPDVCVCVGGSCVWMRPPTCSPKILFCCGQDMRLILGAGGFRTFPGGGGRAGLAP